MLKKGENMNEPWIVGVMVGLMFIAAVSLFSIMVKLEDLSSLVWGKIIAPPEKKCDRYSYFDITDQLLKEAKDNNELEEKQDQLREVLNKTYLDIKKDW